ncbi:MAG: hypothetical protein J3K34DRAFT_434056 [Monoraphidium minutum]|nr:MAG: hypothetical protein J3K34DRAFT_434056 [Monoraphidium minutum]
MIPDPDFKFKETGLLQVRLKTIQTTLDKYRFKDAFWYDAQVSLEDAQQHVSDLLAGLRNQSVNSVSTWRDMYVIALGRVNVASEKSNWVPKGARCGWCTRQSLEQSQGSCTSTCSTPLDCKLSCPGRAPAECALNGYTYTASVPSGGTSMLAQCKVSVTSNACVEYGLLSSAQTGSYYCEKTICDWRFEYCEGGIVERDDTGVWTCLGTCMQRSMQHNESDTCTCSPSRGSLPPDSENEAQCFFGERAEAGMWTPPSGEMWPSLESFKSSFNPKALWVTRTNTGYNGVTSSYLTTDCPPYDPITVQAAPNVHLLGCACRKSDGVWLGKPAA